MHREIEEIKSSLSKLIAELERKALEDDIISEDEQALLECIQRDVENIETQLVEMLGSSLDEHEFRDLATQVLQDMFENALRVAKSDGKITRDEKELIEIIRRFSLEEESE